MKEATCVYLFRKVEGKGEVLLADQQRGIVRNKKKGYGGKIEQGQSKTENVIEETWGETGGIKELRISKNEEGGIKITTHGLHYVGMVDFYNGTEAEVPFGDPSFRVHFFTCSNFSGTPIDTIEMQNHQWYPVNNPPWDKMVIGDDIFLKPIFNGQTSVGWMRRTSDLSKVIDYQID